MDPDKYISKGVVDEEDTNSEIFPNLAISSLMVQNPLNEDLETGSTSSNESMTNLDSITHDSNEPKGDILIHESVYVESKEKIHHEPIPYQFTPAVLLQRERGYTFPAAYADVGVWESIRKLFLWDRALKMNIIRFMQVKAKRGDRYLIVVSNISYKS